MAEIKAVYNSKSVCPVCESDIEYTKVRSKVIRLIKQDTDFCPYYEGENPIFYEAVICPECGYAAHVTNFSSISRYDKDKVRNIITSKWQRRSFTGQRTIDQALEAFKIVLLNQNIIEGLKSEIAKVCMRIAWLYRYKQDKTQENKFLNHALINYKKAYSQEDLTEEGKLDEYTCLYIIGELNKRLGLYEESIKWLSRLIMSFSDPQQKDKIPKMLIETARDLYQEVRDAVAAAKEAT
ncbi:MAG TPA: DUF2225 domain-containing protein [Clostridiaceae bacterium]|jgi:uncharacterized protein (DUF2225 family)|nr:DUF2225 domain-containing protein [Clostridiaceae bacterium]